MIIGLTGGIACGKSICSDYFSLQAASIVDADLIARELVEPDSPLLADLVLEFGSDILSANGNLDRAKMRRMIFSSPDARKSLDALMHPMISRIALSRLRALDGAESIVFYSAALLFETNQDSYCDLVLTVDIPEDLQISRAMLRDNMSLELVQQIISSQMPRMMRLMQSNFILDNSGTLANTYRQCSEFLTYFTNLNRNLICKP